MDDHSAMPNRCHLADKKINTRREYALIFLSVRWHLFGIVLQALIRHTREKKQYISLIIDAYLDSNSWDNVPGEYVTFTFTGVQIKFYGVLDTQHGIGAVSLDGGREGGRERDND